MASSPFHANSESKISSFHAWLCSKTYKMKTTAIYLPMMWDRGFVHSLFPSPCMGLHQRSTCPSRWGESYTTEGRISPGLNIPAGIIVGFLVVFPNLEALMEGGLKITVCVFRAMIVALWTGQAGANWWGVWSSWEAEIVNWEEKRVQEICYLLVLGYSRCMMVSLRQW